jgi:acetyltransferase-like isoleucine patch superfamily enzyme
MRNAITWWLRALRLLRHPEVIHELGRLGEDRRRWEALVAANPARGVNISRDAVFRQWEPSRMRLGESVCIERGSIFVWGPDECGAGHVDIGDHTWIGEYNNFRLSGDSHIVIGRNCLISQFCSIVAANHGTWRDLPIQSQPHDPRKLNVRIGDDVWLGAGVSVMPAVEIGKGAVVGAGSVVTTSIPEYEIWGGIPARKLSEREARDQAPTEARLC